MRKAGTHQHCLYLHDDVVKELRAAAKKHKRSQSEIVEEALAAWFEAYDSDVEDVVALFSELRDALAEAKI